MIISYVSQHFWMFLVQKMVTKKHTKNKNPGPPPHLGNFPKFYQFFSDSLKLKGIKVATFLLLLPKLSTLKREVSMMMLFMVMFIKIYLIIGRRKVANYLSSYNDSLTHISCQFSTAILQGVFFERSHPKKF